MSYSINNNDTQQILLHIKDLVVRCEKTGKPCYTFFLDENQRMCVERFLNDYRNRINFCFWGGYSDAFRTVLCLYDKYTDEPVPEEFPFRCVTFKYNSVAKLTHRDFLGAFMSCMIKRNVIGDIVVSDKFAQAFILEPFGNVLVNELHRIGKAEVTTSDDIPFEERKQAFEKIDGTVPSMRLDAVLHMVLPLSRDKSAELVKRGLVLKNGCPMSSSSVKTEENDIISVRGYGKFRIKEIYGQTKKDRLRICVEKYK